MEYSNTEDDPRYQSIFENIDAEVEAILTHKGYTSKVIGEGWVELFCSAKQMLLKDKYGIDWTSEAQMNPQRVSN